MMNMNTHSTNNHNPNNVQASHEDVRDLTRVFDPNGMMNNDSLARSLGSIIQDELYNVEQDRTAVATAVNLDTTAAQKTFPFKLYEILADEGNKSAIEWVSDGRLWRIVSVAEMERHVLPKYFNHSKYQSFLRQVYRWGFKRYGSDRDCYFHEAFRKDQPECTVKMSCMKQAPSKESVKNSLLSRKRSSEDAAFETLAFQRQRQVMPRLDDYYSSFSQQQVQYMDEMPLPQQRVHSASLPPRRFSLTGGASHGYTAAITAAQQNSDKVNSLRQKHQQLLAASREVLEEMRQHSMAPYADPNLPALLDQQAALRRLSNSSQLQLPMPPQHLSNNRTVIRSSREPTHFQPSTSQYAGQPLGNSNSYLASASAATSIYDPIEVQFPLQQQVRPASRRLSELSIGYSPHPVQHDIGPSQGYNFASFNAHEMEPLPVNQASTQARRASISQAILSSLLGNGNTEVGNFNDAGTTTAELMTKKQVRSSRESNAQSRSKADSKQGPETRVLIRESTPNDVIVARGREASDFEGNRQFQAIIASFKDEFSNLSPYSRARANVARRVVNCVRQKNPPGRFLKEDSASGLWYDAGDEEALKMTMITLRSLSRAAKRAAKKVARVEEEQRAHSDSLKTANDLLALAGVSSRRASASHTESDI
mmetsp:Transcript_7645/g.11365  ORF Transcript_7645/g.11365 Transcript_7645/m.11365 type:complete len:651 (-) Transcript_7645:111-2063(-)|eukprot:CAMPEP_0116025198 /NCGR_PEP_ID=MMETSP0321-20121206/12882_1 /TAXON_ID=163516 /ORGANISM="Leptocylindrus danicus var. danicus, Strain B650" /LENGTH=650 /DNA_ID=CAMNT_0003497299 /DNA_START=115 /DNA_END=2067 /DNA_ORIENTATION=-